MDASRTRAREMEDAAHVMLVRPMYVYMYIEKTDSQIICVLCDLQTFQLHYTNLVGSTGKNSTS